MNIFKIAIVLGGIVFMFLGVPAANAAADSRPNILFLLVDDQRNDSLGCAGHPFLKTPTIDRLARNGTRFENMFATTPVCWVSRANILTGQNVRKHGTPHQLAQVNSTAIQGFYPDHLRKAGYRVGFFGKWHMRAPAGFNPQEHFTDYESIFRNPYFKKQPDGTLRHECQLIVDRGVEFLESHDKAAPFCLNLWFNTAHAEDRDKRPGIGHFPWPDTVDGMYEDVEIEAPYLSYEGTYESQPQHLKDSINRERYFWRWDTPEKYETNIRAYCRMLTGLDMEIARLLKTLEETGLSDNTIIVYSADNGYYMGNRGFAGKWSHYQESIRVPLIIFDPRNQKETGTVDTHLVLNTDLAPTFLNWAGVELPDAYEGRSLQTLLESPETTDWRRDFFCGHVDLAPTLTWEGVRNENVTYARYFDQSPPYEFLHDLSHDPFALKNLATSKKHQELLEQMRQRCDEYVAENGGPVLPLSERRGKVRKPAPKKKPASKK